jgi:aspartate carbamoyltransferase regulatory subunit
MVIDDINIKKALTLLDNLEIKGIKNATILSQVAVLISTPSKEKGEVNDGTSDKI